MYLNILAFLSGITSLLWLPSLPNIIWLLSAGIITVLLWHFSPPPLCQVAKWLFIGLLGCVYMLWRSQLLLNWHLPETIETTTATVTGTVAALPKVDDDSVQFEFVLTSLNHQPQTARILLSWYQYNGSLIQPGDELSLQVRLKRPHGLLNPGGFDYEQWLFSHGIHATGYVVTKLSDTAIVSHYPWLYPVDSMRQRLQQRIHIVLVDQPTEGLITALIMGAQNRITDQQWQVMRATGTNHLMAIAGVHIAFVSGFIFILVNYLWRRSSWLLLKLPAPQAAACGALIAAIIYSALAGFALPTQRAIVMLSVFMLGVFLRRELPVWHCLTLALLSILLWDSFAVLSISFWLSFGAVFAIIYGISGRLKPSGLWWKYGRVQWVISVALIPISLTLFQQTSIISCLANLIAVPAVGILVLPLCLFGTLLLYVVPVAGQWLLIAAAKIIAVIWWLLTWLGSLKFAIWQQTMPSTWVLIASLVGVLLLIAPRGFPARWLGMLWLTPLLFFQPAAPAFGALCVTLLDVGQGLSAVVQTQHHALIFDTGPPFGKQDDAGQRVVLPFLQASGIKKINSLVISHGDSDHIGGAASILKQIAVENILTSVPERFNQPALLCQQGQHWQWDGVTFAVLYPPPQLLHLDNNSSCVLKITAGHTSILLTGDIEKPAEDYLVASEAAELPAQILVAPHHGSRTSSTAEFVQTVHPQYVLFPVGYKNRFHFPSVSVVERFRSMGAALFNTAQDGAIQLAIDKQGVNITTQRQAKRIWRME